MAYWKLYYHLVWGTKNREPLIDDERETVNRRSFRATAEKFGATIHAVGVMPDHVHVVLSNPPTVAISDLVRALKGSSSHLLNHDARTHLVSHFGWQAEYGALTFGERSYATLIAYAENQRSHHADHLLLEEFEVLERPFDPKPATRS